MNTLSPNYISKQWYTLDVIVTIPRQCQARITANIVTGQYLREPRFEVTALPPRNFKADIPVSQIQLPGGEK